ncbi:MAG: hypothetical protein LBD68_11270 [Zoogloeaceae bacterium]|jgi:hypothetical protein|nr:hypothetical protein [Zoogloeaceae bacterium]
MKTEPPALGRYVSQNGRASCTVSDVSVIDSEEDAPGAPPYFVVTVDEDGDPLDGLEFSPDEWREYAELHALTYQV